MIKMTAILLIASGFAVSGCCISAFNQRKADTLSDIVMMISFFKTRLRYECLPLVSLLSLLEQNGKTQNLSFVSVCRERTENGESFSVAWRESIENDKTFCRLICGAEASLISLGEDLGTTDLEGQLSCCRYYESVFCDELSKRKELNGKYSKIYPALGAMLGIWAAILII